jgi:thioredoxin reductase (NADPH)
VQEAAALEARGPARVVRLTDGTELASHAVILATGVSYRRLQAPGVDELTGQGVYYGAAMTEAISCSDQDVFVVGGANSAGQAAMYFARFARSVTILVRGDSLRRSMSHYLIDQIERTENIGVRTHTEVAEVHGSERLEEITLSTGDRVAASALFIFIGAAPHTDWVGDLVMRDDRGFVLSGPQLSADGDRPPGWNVDREPHLLETSVPGIFVAGDVRARSIKRVASAVGEGAMAVQFVHEYLADA